MSTNIFALVLATMFLAAVPSPEAQYVGKVPRVGLLVYGAFEGNPQVEGFQQALRELGMSRDEPSILNTDLRKERASVFLS